MMNGLMVWSSVWAAYPVGQRVVLLVLAAVYGAAFGSFLNVCIYRWGTGQRVSRPHSFCPQCHRTLTWSENIPVLGWLLLRGRCRGCNGAISVHYPLMEAAIALLWVGWAVVLGPTGVALIAALLVTFLVGAVETAWRARVGPWPYALIGAVALSALHLGVACRWWGVAFPVMVGLDGVGVLLLGVPLWGTRLRAALQRD